MTVIGAIGDREHVANLGLEGAPGVDHLVPILKPYKLASLQYRRASARVVDVDGRKIGGDHFATIAGPCTVESREVLLSAARDGQGRRRPDAARRRLQAAHLAVLVPGARRGRPAAAGRGQGGDRACRSSPS